jgi:glutamate carboxypeptidase
VWPIGTITDWPFHVEDGVASGPGVFDMKAGLVIALTAATILDDPSGITLLFNSDEEIGSASSQLLIEDHACPAGAALVCEPSADGGAVKIGRKGIAHYRLEADGRAATPGSNHTSASTPQSRSPTRRSRCPRLRRPTKEPP